MGLALAHARRLRTECGRAAGYRSATGYRSAAGYRNATGYRSVTGRPQRHRITQWCASSRRK